MFDIDHIAICCSDLETGARAFEDQTGLTLSPGGQHPDFGTHNRLLRLGATQYLELIAIDPNAPAPDRARWFDLDAFEGPAKLTNWIVRAADMGAARARLSQEVLQATGAPMALSRGDLRWDLTVPETGRMPYDNCAPALISWGAEDGGQIRHPTDRLPDAGCHLRKLTISHPQADQMASTYGQIEAAQFVQGPPGLTAEIGTPNGRITLR